MFTPLTHRISKTRICALFGACLSLIALGGCASHKHHHHHRADGSGIFSKSALGGLFGHENAGDPPGWDQGRKTGWRGGDVPPGHQKKGNDRDVDINININGDRDHPGHDHGSPGKAKGKGKGNSGK